MELGWSSFLATLTLSHSCFPSLVSLTSLFSPWNENPHRGLLFSGNHFKAPQEEVSVLALCILARDALSTDSYSFSLICSSPSSNITYWQLHLWVFIYTSFFPPTNFITQLLWFIELYIMYLYYILIWAFVSSLLEHNLSEGMVYLCTVGGIVIFVISVSSCVLKT